MPRRHQGASLGRTPRLRLRLSAEAYTTALTINPTTRHEFKIFGLLAAIFGAVYFLPVGTPRFDGAVTEALELTKWYAREHVVLCLLPAFWIAGLIITIGAYLTLSGSLGWIWRPGMTAR